jgi:GDP-L-fucose synthase
MKILLLGATGFLGSRLALRLEQEGLPFIPVARSLGTDLRDPAQFAKLFSANPGVDIVIQAATFIGGIKFGLDHPAEIYHDNTLISTNLFELARKFNVRRIINPVSNCSYPRDIYPEFKEELWWNGPLDDSVRVYGMVRKMSYVQSVAYHQQYGLETINLIVPNMYGPGDHFEAVRSHALGALVMKIVQAKIGHQPSVQIWGSGSPVREWLYVDDCVEAMMRSLSIPYEQEPINIGIGMGVSITELAQMIKQEAGYTGDLVYDRTKPDGAPYKVMNIDRCKRVFNWHPSTALAEGIKKTVAWYRDNVLKADA